MLLTLLFLCQVSTEWVEISQQTYRKPLNPVKIHSTIYQPYITTTDVYVETSKKIEFLNQSLTDKHWSKGTISRVPHVGLVKRVHSEPVRDKTKIVNYETRRPFLKETTQNAETDGGTLSMKLNLLEQNVVTPHSEENFDGNRKTTSFKRNPFVTINQGSKTPAAYTQQNEYNSPFDDEKEDPPTAYDASEESFKSNEQKRNNLKLKTPTVNEQGTLHEQNQENIDVTLLPTSQFGTMTKITESNEGVMKSPEEINMDLEKFHHIHDRTTSKETATKIKSNTNQQNTSPKVNNSKVNTMENIIKLLKLVSKTIAQNTKQSFESKLKYLNNMKNTLMANIESHINATWPDDGHRSARAVETSRSHVDFPSSESALMTISFLTFAVFLIKLVLQVIHKYKNPMMMTNGVVTTVKRAAALAARPPDPDITYD